MSSPAQLSPLDRFPRLFADVRSGEGLTALLLSVNVFLLLACYYILRIVRDTLILSENSAEVQSYSAAAMVAVLIPLVPLYGRLADRVPRRRLINVVTWIFAGSFVVFFVLAQAGLRTGIPYYIWIGVFNMMIVAQFWSFANDLYAKEEGERLFPIIAFGQSLGAVLGAGIARLLIEPIGILPLLPLGAAALLAQVQVTNYVDRRERRAREAGLPREQTTRALTATGEIRVEDVQKLIEAVRRGEDPRQVAEAEAEVTPEAQTTGPFALVFRTRYLLLMALMIMTLNFVNTTGGYVLNSVLEDSAAAAFAVDARGLAEGQFTTQYFGRFFSSYLFGVSLAGLLIQLFLVSRIIKYLGVPIALMILPVIALGAYALIAFVPVLGYVRWAKTAENATDYSLQNTVKQVLFLPTTREQKYKAKQAIDSFFVRVGDTLSAVLVFVGTSFLALSTTGFALVNFAGAAIWLVLAVLIGAEYRRLVGGGEPGA